jgi:hypothetical protein
VMPFAVLVNTVVRSIDYRLFRRSLEANNGMNSSS